MLDLYHIADTIPTDQVDRAHYLGSLSMAEHKTLRGVFDHPDSIPFSFFDDSRLSYQQVQIVLARCRSAYTELIAHGNRGNISYTKLITMLEAAVAHEHGILLVCE